MKRTPLILGAVGLVAGLVGGGLFGRSTQDEEAAGLPVAAPVTTLAGDVAPAPLPGAFDTAAAEYPGTDGGAALTSATPYGAPTAGAGPLVPNTGGAPDLTPDPEAGISGTPPTVEGAPEDPARPDSEVLEAVTTMMADAATVAPVAAAPTPSFDDPCVDSPTADGCGTGVEATVLGIRRRPAPQGVWHGEVHANSIYAAECARQWPGLDWRADSVWAIVVTVPMGAAHMDVQFFHAHSGYTYDTPAGTRVESLVSPSEQMWDAWNAAWASGTATPLVPLCLKMPYTMVEQNRAGCIPAPPSYWPCSSVVEMSVRGSDDMGFPWGAGRYRDWFFFVEQGSLALGEAAALRREVQIVPLDSLTVEVKIPFTNTVTAGTDQQGHITRTAQLVSAVGYPAGVDCRTVDPASGVRLDPAAVTRQVAQTRYWSPDDARRQDREAVVTLGMPSQLAAGEGINICVYWYTFDGPSWQGPTVVNIEQHTVVPPSRAATEIRYAGAGVGGDIFSLPHAQPRDAIRADRLILSFLELSALNNACGFNPSQPVTVLQPLDDPGFICRVDWPAFADRPTDVLTYVQLKEPIVAGTADVINSHAQRRVMIDNRGCPATGCGPARTERFNLHDGSWVDLTFTKVPSATTPQLPNGRIIGGRHDGWTVNPTGYVTLAPNLPVPTPPENPLLDSIGTRIVANPASPQTALDLVWRADRPVIVSVSLAPRYRVSDAACPTRTVVVPEVGGTPTDRGRITIGDLCPGTNYVAQIQLIQERDTGAEPAVTTVEWDTGQWLYLTGTTEPAPVPADFDYEYSLSIEALEGSPSVLGAVGSGTVFFGPAVLMGAPPTARNCGTIDASRPIAAGFRGADQIAGGETRVQIDLTVTLWSADQSGTPCPPAGQLWAGRPVRIQIVETIRWDGTTRQTFQLTTGNGTVVALTLSPVVG